MGLLTEGTKTYLVQDTFKNDVLLYLASPYTHPDDKVREQRYQDAKEATAFLLKSGFMTFSPIVYSHTLSIENAMMTSFAFWGPIDLRILRSCDVLCLLTLDGWKASKGMKAEFEYAQTLGKSIWTLELTGAIGVLRSSPQWEVSKC